MSFLMRKAFWGVSCFCFFWGASLHAAPRTWTSSEGKTLSAEFVGADSEQVELKSFNGKKMKLARTRLSEKDNAFIEDQLARLQKEKEEEEDGVDMPDKWPEIVAGPEEFKLKESSQKKKEGSGMIYRSKHFEFTTSTPLDDAAKEAVGRLYEATWMAIKAMPLPIDKVKKNSSKPFLAKLAKDYETYLDMGGPKGSAGVFMSRGEEGVTIVPYGMLNLSKEGVLDASTPIKSHVLAHEITHQLTHGSLGRDTWVVEGFADYVGAIPYDGKSFDFTAAFKSIQQNAARANLVVPYTFEEFLTMSQDEFYDKSNGGAAGPRNYLLGTVCVAYFFHLGGEVGVKDFRDYIVASSKGKKNAIKQLYGKRKPAELEQDLVAAWEKQGVKVGFAPAQDSKKKKKSSRKED